VVRIAVLVVLVVISRSTSSSKVVTPSQRGAASAA
jgi:hypothetical protein